MNNPMIKTKVNINGKIVKVNVHKSTLEILKLKNENVRLKEENNNLKDTYDELYRWHIKLAIAVKKLSQLESHLYNKIYSVKR